MTNILSEYIEVNSSMIQTAFYDKRHRNLILTFNDGNRYLYEDVPSGTYEGLRTAESKGRYLHRNVIKLFSFKKV
jgi:hypothetical protein